MEQRRLVSDNIDLAQKLANKRYNKHVPPEDRLQNAYMGLIDAAQNFDEAVHCSFRTYAGYRIIGAMIDAERRTASFIRVGRTDLGNGVKSPKVFPAGGWSSREFLDHDPTRMTPEDLFFVAPEPSITYDDVDAIETALASFSERDRYIARRRLCDGETHKQIGAEIGRPENRVNQIAIGITGRLRVHSALSHYARERAE